MSDMNINRYTSKPLRKDLPVGKAAKKADVSSAGDAGQQAAKGAAGLPERKLDTLVLSEQAKLRTSKQVAGAMPQRASGETDEHWMKRLISYETANAWRASSRQWKEESRSIGIAEGIEYQGQKATQWVTTLMEKEPAMFREWLNREAWHLEEGDLDNAILPEGFTEADFQQWMERDVLDYL